jgi:hypothetical protein
MDPYFILIIKNVYFIDIQKYFVLEFKRQHTQLSFILHLTFNKIGTFPKAIIDVLPSSSLDSKWV